MKLCGLVKKQNYMTQLKIIQNVPLNQNCETGKLEKISKAAITQ